MGTPPDRSKGGEKSQDFEHATHVLYGTAVNRPVNLWDPIEEERMSRGGGA